MDVERMYAAGAKTLIDIGIASAAAASAFGLLDFLRVPRGARAPLATVLAAVRHLG